MDASTHECNILTEYLIEHGVRTININDELLFAMTDICKLIKESNSARSLNNIIFYKIKPSWSKKVMKFSCVKNVYLYLSIYQIDKAQSIVAYAQSCNIVDIEKFIKYFEGQNIRLIGTLDNPRFNLYDIAKKIEDYTYFKKISELSVVKETVEGEKYFYLTKDGVLNYLLGSDKPNAKIFRQIVVNFIVNKTTFNNIFTLLTKWLLDLEENCDIDEIRPEPDEYPDDDRKIKPHVDDSLADACIMTNNDVISYVDKIKSTKISGIYFIRLYASYALGVDKPVYKYGKSTDIKSRLLNYTGHPAKIEKIIEINEHDLTKAEDIIRQHARKVNENHVYINLHELIVTDDIHKYYKLL